MKNMVGPTNKYILKNKVDPTREVNFLDLLQLQVAPDYVGCITGTWGSNKT